MSEFNLTRQELFWFFDYDSLRGTLIWRNVTHANKKFLIGQFAGTFDDEGYTIVKLRRRPYKIHRLIWFLENGTWPEQIDHINGDREDNRIENLREAKARLNCQNKQHHRNGNLVGATFNKFHQRWQSQIEIDRKRKHLGYYDTEVKAHEAYLRALP